MAHRMQAMQPMQPMQPMAPWPFACSMDDSDLASLVKVAQTAANLLHAAHVGGTSLRDVHAPWMWTIEYIRSKRAPRMAL